VIEVQTLKIQEFLTASAGLSVAPTLVRLNEWLASIQAGTLEKPARRLAKGDPTERIAESLIANASGTERRLLSKSFQEALYYAVSFDADIAEAQLIAQLSQYLRRWGASAFIRRFLSLFFFNFVHFETGKSFRGLARSSQAFEKHIEDIDRVCHQTVASIWKSFEETKRPLDLTAATELVRQIEQRLGGKGVLNASSPCDEVEAESRRLLELEYEIEAQRRHLTVLELERDELYQRQHAGEYDCPYCLYRRLKTGVSHCPSCHAEITLEQWRPIFEFERTLAKEGPKKEPESPHKPQSPPEVNEAKRRKRTARKYKAKQRNTWVSIYGGLIFPIVTLLAGAAFYWFWMR